MFLFSLTLPFLDYYSTILIPTIYELLEYALFNLLLYTKIDTIVSHQSNNKEPFFDHL